MKVLVTGGLGFLGGHMITAYASLGHEVTCFDVDGGRQHPQAAHYVVGDLLSRHLNALDHAVEGHDLVVHCAANASVRGGVDHPALDLQQNLIGTSNLLEAMRQDTFRARLIFASSSAVYGNPTIVPTPEDAVTSEQTSMYGASKLAAEALISAYCHGFGLRATILRFAPLLGEGYHRGFVYDLWRKIRANPECVEVLGDGKQRKAYVYVKDAVQAALIADQNQTGPVGVFNVGNDSPVSVDEALNWICDELAATPKREYTGKSWAGDKPVTWLDATRIRALGWQPTVTIEDAVRRTVRSFHE